MRGEKDPSIAHRPTGALIRNVGSKIESYFLYIKSKHKKKLPKARSPSEILHILSKDKHLMRFFFSLVASGNAIHGLGNFR